MNYRVVIHSIDLQDREGFLAFLDAYARKGYEAVRIFRSFTVFEKRRPRPEATVCASSQRRRGRQKASGPSHPGAQKRGGDFPGPRGG